MLHLKFATIRSYTVTTMALLLCLCFSMGTATAANDIKNIRVAKSGEITRVVFDTEGIPKYKIFTLNNPSRIVIDFSDSKLTTKVNQSLFKASHVAKLRHATRDQNKLRVVLDLNQQIIPKSFVLPPHDGANHRLVLDLKGAQVKTRLAKAPIKTTPKKKTVTASKKKTVAAAPKKTATKKAAPKKDIIAQVTTPKAKKKPAAPKKSKVASAKARDFVVAVDPGHGGKDPGAIGYAGTREKDVVLQISKRLVRLINAEPGMRAVLTRDSDRFLTLRGRIKKARDNNADVFVSVHADAIDDRRVRGSSVYVLSKNGASSEAAKILAQRHNRSDVIGGVSLEGKDKVLQKVIVDLSQTATIDASMDLAKSVLKELGNIGKTRKRIEHAGFVVLKLPDIPSILVETAFISNASEEKKLRSAEHQQKLANSIFRGVRTYMDKHAPDNAIIAKRTPKEKHVIRPGETLSGIALRYRVSLDSLRSVNSLQSDKIRVGQKLLIPGV